ncbi:MAG: hypothetical protein HFE59_10245 [Clostridiales bacterium]|jgi:hypothetical protein|nr:hypothetical protein [Clostridiales bacterium]
MNLKQICEIVNVNKIRELPTHYIIYSKNIKIWINKEENKVTQILAENKFKAKYKELIGIGSTLKEIHDKLKINWYEELDCYYLEGIDGMCFELGDSGNDEYWDEETVPIVYISVFK